MARQNRLYKRKREGRTDYKARLKLLKSGKTRLVIRRKLSDTIIQFIQYNPDGDKTISTFTKKNIEKLGWKGHGGNRSSAYLIGLLAGLKNKNKVKEAVLDLGLQQSIAGSSIYSALKGVLDSGIKISHSEKILPNDNLIKGSKISEYSKKIDKGKYQKQFSGYIKNNFNPEDFEKHFEEIKKKIIK